MKADSEGPGHGGVSGWRRRHTLTWTALLAEPITTAFLSRRVHVHSHVSAQGRALRTAAHASLWQHKRSTLIAHMITPRPIARTVKPASSRVPGCESGW
jgi:hypothetical protein